MTVLKFAQRRDGSEAEKKFSEWATRRGIEHIPYGFRRPDYTEFPSLPSFIRHTPDFIAFWSGKHLLIETKGMGRDGVFKLKLADLLPAQEWSKFLPLWYFIWNSSTQAVAIESCDDITELCVKAPQRRFAEGTPYYAIEQNMLKWSPYE